MRAIVTGGLGFIGSSLINMLLSMGFYVYVVDNKTSNVINEDDVVGNCDVVIDSVDTAVNFFPLNVDVVFHLACFVGPAGVLQHAGEMGKLIVSDTYKLRNYCIENGAMFVDISTSEIYGHTDLLSEDSKKVYPGRYNVRTEYSAGKMLGEIITVNKAKVEDRLKYHIIRPFNVAGIRQKPDGGFVLPRFILAALTDQPITIFDDGTQERAFTDVKDICTAIVKIVQSKYINHIWNIGNIENKMTINELACKVIKHVKKRYPEKKCKAIHVDPKTIHGPLFTEAIDKVPYTKKLEDLVGWEAKKNVDQTINDIIDYYSEKIKHGYYFKVL